MMTHEMEDPGALAGASGADRKSENFVPKHSGSQPRRQRAVAWISDRNGEWPVVVSGRQLWTLRQLIDVGQKGCTAVANPAPRWSGYVHKLRRAGVPITTERETHGGPYAGTHGRYRLAGVVRLDERGT